MRGGIYSDHIAHHILMFMLALSRGLPYWMEAQRGRRWDQGARKHGYVNVVGSTVLINGVGGIGAETARLCVALGARVVGIDPRPEHDCPAEIHAPSALDDLLPGGRLRGHHRAAHAGDRVHVERGSLPAHEAVRVLHQYRPGNDRPAR